jgi:hypothetical protein
MKNRPKIPQNGVAKKGFYGFSSSFEFSNSYQQGPFVGNGLSIVLKNPLPSGKEASSPLISGLILHECG